MPGSVEAGPYAHLLADFRTFLALARTALRRRTKKNTVTTVAPRA
jgi:hypothetical protein